MPKSWEGLASVMLKAIALRQELTPKPVEYDEGDEEFDYDPDYVDSEEDLQNLAIARLDFLLLVERSPMP